MSDKTISDMVGRTFVSAEGKTGGEDMVFVSSDGWNFHFYHSQGCCESVVIEDICGDMANLVGSPMLMAEEVGNMDEPYEGGDSYTWTFYKFATVKGYVTVRWLGQSNGYYSERVDFDCWQSQGDEAAT